MTAWGGARGSSRLRGVIGVIALFGLVALMIVTVRSSMDPGPRVGVTPRTTPPPITVHLTNPTIPPLRVPPVEPK